MICRFLDMDVPEDALRDRDRFRYVEPEDKAHLMQVVADLKQWRPDVAVVDSVGELLPLMNLSSNSPDDFTLAHTHVLKSLAVVGACVIAIDHLAKSTESRAQGSTGTAAKRRAVGGVSIRVTVDEPFTPGRGGSAFLSINKDRHGGLRRHSPPPAGRGAAGGHAASHSGPLSRWHPQVHGTGTGAGRPGTSASSCPRGAGQSAHWPSLHAVER